MTTLATFLAGVFALPSSRVSMLMLLVKATLILVTALGITVVMRRASAGARHLVWLVTLCTLLLVPALTAWAPLRFRVLPAPEAVQATANQPAIASDNRGLTPDSRAQRGSLRTPELVPQAAVSQQSAIASGPQSAVRTSEPISIFRILLTVWATIVVGLALWLTYGAMRVRWIVRRAVPLDTPDWLNPLYEVSDRLGIDEAPRLLRSEDAKMPFACGLLRATIILPAECDHWTQDRRLAVLLHELAHVRRHDLVGHTLGRLACAVYWFHPLVWKAAKQLRSESERACDDLALACGARASDYAEHLLDIVTSVRQDATPAVALAMARRKEFEGRMLAILDPDLRHSGPSRLQSAGLIASLALVAIVVGAAAPAPKEAHAATAPKRVAETHAPLTMAPQPKVEAPTTSKLEQIKEPLAKNDKPAEQHADAGPGTMAQQMIQSVVQATATSTSTALREVAKQVIKEKPLTVIPGTPTTVNALAGLIESIKAGKQQGKDDRAVLLANILRTDTSASLRRIAAWGLSEYADQPVASDALTNALRRDSNPVVREMAAWALADGDAKNSAAVDAEINALRSDSDQRVRHTAVWALGEMSDDRAIDALTNALSDSDAEIRSRAIWAIGQIEPHPAPKQLIDKLRDPDKRVRQMTAWALFQIEDPAAIPALDAALRAETDQKLQVVYIKALSALGEKSVDAVKHLLDSKDPEIRGIAVRALAGAKGTDPWPMPWPQPRPYP